MAHIKDISFSKVGKLEGVVCDKCGQYITNVWAVTYDDGTKLNYGIDCFEKLQKQSKLTSYGIKLMNKSLKSISHWSEELSKWESGFYTEENRQDYKYDSTNSDSYWYKRSFDEYKDFMSSIWIPARLADAQKEINRFSKVNFTK